MSDVIVIDDQPNHVQRPHARRRRTALAQPIVIEDSDADSRSHEQEGGAVVKHTSVKRAQQAAEDSEDDGAPKPKRQRRQKTQKQAPEKRTNAAGVTVRFSAQPSQAIYQRIQRALPGSGHRMFLINSKELAPAGAPSGRAQEFAVLGATGNVYDVTISRHPHCTCPDHAKGNLCKHILFVLLRVLKLATDNPLVWQKALLTKEVEEVLSGAHSQSVDHLAGVLADDRVRQAYAAAAGSQQEDKDAAPAGRRAVEGDCAICFDELKDGGEALVWCQSCGNNLHKSCWDRWVDAKRKSRNPVTCVYCRAPWPDAAAAAGADSPGGYMNLAQLSSAHAGADTSLETLYGPSAMWIHSHAAGRSRGNTARMWRRGYGY